MEDVRIDAALRKLGTCEVSAPARLFRNMVLTVRSLEQEKMKRLAAQQPEKEAPKQQPAKSSQQLGKPKKKTL